jgi:uncharacterized protein YciI
VIHVVFAVIYKVENMSLNNEARAGHVEFLRQLAAQGVYKDAWKFPDYEEGDIHSVLLIEGESKEAVEDIFLKDPVVANGARSVKVRIWEPSRLLRENK